MLDTRMIVFPGPRCRKAARGMARIGLGRFALTAALAALLAMLLVAPASAQI